LQIITKREAPNKSFLQNAHLHVTSVTVLESDRVVVMAIYHLTVKTISRGKGQSAVACAAYRRAALLYDERMGKHYDFRKKSDVIHNEIAIPPDSPVWLKDIVDCHAIDKKKSAEQLWNFVEANEKRVDARLAREIEFALPLELTVEQNIQLAREFITDQFALRGMIADWNVHWDAGNPHVHVMLTTRKITEEGFAEKVTAWNDKALLLEWRKQWAEYANFHLRLHCHEVRIDHRSYEAQGIDLVPSRHLGKAVTDMVKRGIKTNLMQEAKEIQQENLARIKVDPSILLKKISTEQDVFGNEELANELARYSPLDAKTIAEIFASLEYHDSVFTERSLAKALLPFAEQEEVFTQALLQLKSSPELLYLGIGHDGRERYTTKTMFAHENRIQQLADTLRDRVHQKISVHHQDKILEQHQIKTGKQLTPEQKVAVKHILNSSAISCLVGRAGTGKSFSLGAAKAVWESQGLKVQGIALSGIAADGLSREANIPSRTIRSFCFALEQKHFSLTAGDVIVMDEAGMADNHSMVSVLEAVHAAGAKLVLVGDPAQLQPVGPGASFRALIERIGFAEIQTIYRQKENWQRQATLDFAAGRSHLALESYYKKRCIHFSDTELSAMQDLVADWQLSRQTSKKDLCTHLIMAHRNIDVDALNQLVRQQRIQNQEIQKVADNEDGYFVQTEKGLISLSNGDRLLFLKIDQGLGVTNGRFATVTHLDVLESGKVKNITVQLDGTEKKSITFNPNQYSHFTYGYAATVHKAQGVTVDHSFIYTGGRGWNRNLAYVAGSRHRESCHFYIDKENHNNFAHLKKQLGRPGTKDSVMDFPLIFAERRGIDTKELIKRIGKHLADKLNQLKEKLFEGYENLLGLQNCAANQVNHITEKAVNETQAIPNLQSLLLDYVNLEIKQSKLVKEMYSARHEGPESAKEATAKAQANAKAIRELAKAAVQQADLIQIYKGMETTPSIRPSLSQRGGFSSIHERMQQGQYLREDVELLVLQLRNEAKRDQSLSRSQERDRGGRSY
jgi:ATP-dependent exoDNAse (exonuclease V) alpha subunit